MNKSASCEIIFEPAGRKVCVKPGLVLLEAARRAGIFLNAPCGGNGICGRCRVRILQGICAPSVACRAKLSPAALRRGYRLACQAKVFYNLTVAVPPAAPPATSNAPPRRRHRLLPQPCGLAVDLGTTTISAMLIRLRGGRKAVSANMANPQKAFGDDIMARVQACRENPQNLERLRIMAVNAVNRLIGNLTMEAGIGGNDIIEVALAGNTAMQQIMLGIDPSALGEAPFAAAFREAPARDAKTMGLQSNARGRVYVFPQIGGFVGGDTVAAILATNLPLRRKPALLIDIGTNCEIVLQSGQHILAASAAAGPAFEGARISCGMRAVPGAIAKVKIKNDLHRQVIGNTRPAGICGSGLMDLAAELLRVGILNDSGRLRAAAELPAGVPAALRRRLRKHAGRAAFLLAGASETAAGRALWLTQRDVRELQAACAAVRAGVALLLKRARLKPQNLNCVFLAGLFGGNIRRSSAQRLLLPQIPCAKINFAGNAALIGAAKSLSAPAVRRAAAAIARRAKHVELALDPEFLAVFNQSLHFTDAFSD